MKLAVNTVIFGLNGAARRGARARRGGRHRPRDSPTTCSPPARSGAPYVGYKRAAFVDPDGDAGRVLAGPRREGPAADHAAGRGARAADAPGAVNLDVVRAPPTVGADATSRPSPTICARRGRRADAAARRATVTIDATQPADAIRACARREQPMADRILIRGGDRPDPGPGARRAAAGGRARSRATGSPRSGRDLPPTAPRSSTPTGDIVIPGFIDTHRHTWETSIRTCAPDYALVAYFGSILDKFAPHYRPDDVYAANLWGALECINAGITTLVDWSHIMNTPDHADAAIRGPPGVAASARSSPTASATRRSWTGGSGRTTRAAS